MTDKYDANLYDRNLGLEAVRVTEAAAIACINHIGRGDKNAADGAAVDAMRAAFNRMDIDGTVVIGEGEMDEAPMLYIGERVGSKRAGSVKVDIALDPLEGTTPCSQGMEGSCSVVAFAKHGNLLNAPDIYMDKIAVGKGLPTGIVDLDRSPKENIVAVARAKGKSPRDMTICTLNRDRHSYIIDAARALGARVQLIENGDVAGVIACALTEKTGVDMFIGKGGAPEGVIAAAALRCVGGQMQGRLCPEDDAEIARMQKWGLHDATVKYTLEDMAKGDVMFCATGITDSMLAKGVRVVNDRIYTETLMMRSKTGTVRTVLGEHDLVRKDWVWI